MLIFLSCLTNTTELLAFLGVANAFESLIIRKEDLSYKSAVHFLDILSILISNQFLCKIIENITY
jgi:branched-subunit amino acid permease